MIIWLIIAPLFFVSVVYFTKRNFDGVGYPLVLGVSLICLIYTISLVSLVKEQGILIYQIGGWSFYNGIVLAADQLSIFMLLVVQGIIFFALIYSKGYFQEDQVKYYSLVMFLQAGLTGMILTSDLFNMYVFLEIVSIVSYALVAFRKDQYGLEAGFKYLLFGSIGSVLILWAISLVYALTGNLNLAYLSQVVGELSPLVQRGIFLLFFVGFSAKFAIVPYHPWLPDAHASAPSPVSAILSAVVIKVPLYALFRIYSLLFPWSFIFRVNFHWVLLVLGAVTIVVGHLMALQQKQLKRLLAYSSVAQIGYIVLGLGIGTPMGVAGGLFHVLNHGILKAGLFFIAGALLTGFKIKEVEGLKGLFYKTPFLSISFFVLSLGMMGIPPLNGFLSKWIITMAAMDRGYYIPAAIVVLGGLLALFYYARILVLFFVPAEQEGEVKKAVNPYFLIPIGAMVLVAVGSFAFGNDIFHLVQGAAEVLFENTQYIQTIVGGGGW